MKYSLMLYPNFEFIRQGQSRRLVSFARVRDQLLSSEIAIEYFYRKAVDPSTMLINPRFGQCETVRLRPFLARENFTWLEPLISIVRLLGSTIETYPRAYHLLP